MITTSRPTLPALRRLGPALVVATLITLPLATPAAASTDIAPSGPCTEPDGVTVVVDLTDLGGELEIGCAEAPATGTEALAAAGFTETRDASGMICAIDSLPDPCPETFEGSYWSYWYAEPAGEWQSYMEGSDTAVPVSGNVEGWRYSDGSEGPSIEPAAVGDATEDEVVVEETEAADDGADVEATEATEATEAAEAGADAADDGTAVSATDEEPAQQAGTSSALVPAIVLVALLAAAAVLVARRRSSNTAGDEQADQS